jgi:Zn-dependent M28 family amino/carboxypeptidase
MFIVLLLAAVMVFPLLKSCLSDNTTTTNNTQQTNKPTVPQVPVPDFNGDSAYYFVQKQVDFGSRVPNSAAHRKCAEWIAAEFRRMGLNVIEQKFQARHYDGRTLNGVNIIAQYNPQATRRILYAAHWDSRFIADKDDKDQQKPILGADDGGSGVGVLLEMARTLQNNPVDIGVDFVCFDLEDQGNDADDGKDHSETWCLGAQHWARNLHQPGYMPQFGILLDMVGAKNPRFQKEGVSRTAAPLIVDKVWALAASMGYGGNFVNEDGQGITDDHLFVIRYARIPMIDIINRPETTDSGFVPHWHTHDDNMSAIDKSTLKMVGQVCTAVIYQTYNGLFL